MIKEARSFIYIKYKQGGISREKIMDEVAEEVAAEIFLHKVHWRRTRLFTDSTRLILNYVVTIRSTVQLVWSRPLARGSSI